MALDNKYGRVTVENEPGNPLGEDEPVFVIRARDYAAPDGILDYAHVAVRAGASSEFYHACATRAQEFRKWQEENPDLVKIPD